MFPVDSVASSVTGEWVKLAWSKSGWGKGQVSWKLTRGRRWYKLHTFFLLPHNYVSDVPQLDFVNQPPDELGNHIDSRLEWEFSTFSLPCMFKQYICLSLKLLASCHTYSIADCAHMVFPRLSYTI